MTYERGDTPLHPDVAILLETMAASKAVRVLDASAQRLFDEMMAAAFNADLPALSVEEEIAIPGPAGDIRALVLSAAPRGDRALPVVLHMHGGGFVIMKPETALPLSKTMAIDGDVIVVSIEYRLAPEHPYPAALDDAVAAFRWLRGHASEIGGDPARIAVAGDSAGGALAGALPLRLVAEGDAPPEAVVLVSAWLDLTMSSPSSRRFGPDDPLIDDEVLSYWRGCYAPAEAQWRDPFVSPAFGDVSSYPPSCVIVGAIDPFLDENVQFAGKLRDAGRTVDLHTYDGMPHWFTMFPQSRDLTDYAKHLGAFLKQAPGTQAAAK